MTNLPDRLPTHLEQTYCALDGQICSVVLQCNKAGKPESWLRTDQEHEVNVPLGSPEPSWDEISQQILGWMYSHADQVDEEHGYRVRITYCPAHLARNTMNYKYVTGVCRTPSWSQKALPPSEPSQSLPLPAKRGGNTVVVAEASDAEAQRLSVMVDNGRMQVSAMQQLHNNYMDLHLQSIRKDDAITRQLKALTDMVVGTMERTEKLNQSAFEALRKTAEARDERYGMELAAKEAADARDQRARQWDQAISQGLPLLTSILQMSMMPRGLKVPPGGLGNPTKPVIPTTVTNQNVSNTTQMSEEEIENTPCQAEIDLAQAVSDLPDDTKQAVIRVIGEPLLVVLSDPSTAAHGVIALTEMILKKPTIGLSLDKALGSSRESVRPHVEAILTLLGEQEEDQE